MESYDEIVGFDYTSENEWGNWIREKFLPLHKQISIILKLREYLGKALKTNFKETFNQKSIKEILLGGVTREGEYTPNSLAKLYKDALGISINPKEWVAYCKAGLDPTENGIECKFENTTFLTFISEIKELIEEVLSKIGEELEEIEDKEIEDIISSPEKLLEVIRELYKILVSISANYDYHMFFILNTRCIPRFFIEKAYPRLRDNFEKVAEILELKEMLIPNISDAEIKRKLTLIGHKENGIAFVLLSINDRIWRYSSELDNFWKNIGIQITNLKNKYYENAKQILEKLGWKKPEYIRISDPPGSQQQHIAVYYYTYHIDGMIINHYSWWGISARTGNYLDGKEECNISLLQFLRDISPALFLNYYWLKIENNGIQIVRSD